MELGVPTSTLDKRNLVSYPTEGYKLRKVGAVVTRSV